MLGRAGTRADLEPTRRNQFSRRTAEGMLDDDIHGRLEPHPVREARRRGLRIVDHLRPPRGADGHQPTGLGRQISRTACVPFQAPTIVAKGLATARRPTCLSTSLLINADPVRLSSIQARRHASLDRSPLSRRLFRRWVHRRAQHGKEPRA